MEGSEIYPSKSSSEDDEYKRSMRVLGTLHTIWARSINEYLKVEIAKNIDAQGNENIENSEKNKSIVIGYMQYAY